MSRSSRRINDFGITEESLRRGGKSEEIVEECLVELVAERKLFHFVRSEPNDILDNAGIDFLTWPEPNFQVGFQVKSSMMGAISHQSGPQNYVPWVVVGREYNKKQIKKEILLALGLSTENLVL